MTSSGDIFFPYRRRSTRLKNHDYRHGIYFVTICTSGRESLFGSIEHDRMFLNAYGCIAHECWKSIPAHFPFVQLDAFIVMPNHMHGILKLQSTDCRGKACLAPTIAIDRAFRKPPAQSLCSVIGSFKSAAARKINILRDGSGESVWQRNYHDHIIESFNELRNIRAYIEANPKHWSQDGVFIA